ncbi:MAG: ABC transporter ATP-binding protein [Gelidibacter sp.]
MENIILKAENISKQYRLGTVGTGTISHDLNRWWSKVRGKEDPFLKIGDTNDRSIKGNSDYVWALQHINFKVKQGEVLGIIGRNGAGKSTLLKILSRVTSPTTGEIKTKGRIASLLEVGTGFHPELTGRENIYLNGAILGMTKAEIKAKEDEIIDFSGCARYIDTPVKRYSSGMTVRLAFAVAAHLEPDILVVDEVLAVGDAEFQKKAIGKMQDISKTAGRTVLFVSHNMAAVKSLCNRAIILDQGKIIYEGNVDESLRIYKELSSNESIAFNFSEHKPHYNTIKISKFSILDINGESISECLMGDNFNFEFNIESKIETSFTLRVAVFDDKENRILAFDSSDIGSVFEISKNQIKKIKCIVSESINLKSGKYYLNISLRRGAILYDHIVGVTTLMILEKDIFGYGRFSYSDMPIILKKHQWEQL